MIQNKIFFALTIIAISTTNFGMQEKTLKSSNKNLLTGFYNHKSTLHKIIRTGDSTNLSLNLLPKVSNKENLKKILTKKSYDGSTLLHHAAVNTDCFVTLLKFIKASQHSKVEKTFNPYDNMGITPATWYIEFRSNKTPIKDVIENLNTVSKKLEFKLNFIKKKSKNFLQYNYFLTYECICESCQLENELEELTKVCKNIKTIDHK